MQDKVYILGDIHGSFKPVRALYQRHPYTFQNEHPTLILLGDAGLNFFFNYCDEDFKKKLGRYPFTYFVIRGNHEQRPSICMAEHPDKWHMAEYWENQVYVENDYPYIKYALDEMAVYNIPMGIDYVESDASDEDVEVQKFCHTLVIPGAYSVDKYKRLQKGWSWFEQEQLSEDEMNRGRTLLDRDTKMELKCEWMNPIRFVTGESYDLVLSHTCPICYEPTDLFLSIVDQSTVDKTMERFLGSIEYRLDYHAWCWGHYHKYREYPRLEDDRRRLMLFNDAAVELENLLWTSDIIKQI